MPVRRDPLAELHRHRLSAGYQWSTVVQDNGGTVSDLYTTAGAAGQPGYDANGDGKLWVRGQATVRGETRRLLGEVEAAEVPLPFPRNTVTAGYFQTTNSGNKVIVDTQGESGQSGDVDVRCTGATGCTTDAYRTGQSRPDTFYSGYSGRQRHVGKRREQPEEPRDRQGHVLRVVSGEPHGEIVFIESGNCSYSGGSGNSDGSPGMVVINSGTLVARRQLRVLRARLRQEPPGEQRMRFSRGFARRHLRSSQVRLPSTAWDASAPARASSTSSTTATSSASSRASAPAS